MTFRKIPFSLIALAVALLLAACQSGSSTPQVTAQPTASGRTPRPDSVPPTSTSGPAETPTPDHPVVSAEALRGKAITFWHPWQGEVDARAKAAVDEFNRSNEWGIQVTVRSLYSDGALEDAFDSSDPAALPDVIAGTSAQLGLLGEAGAVVDLNPYLRHPETGFTEAEVSGYYQAEYWGQDVFDAPTGEVRLGIPLLRTARVLFYNQTWARELGYTTPPITPADFKAQSCAAAVVNNQSRSLEKLGTGGWMIDADPLTGLSWFNAFGTEIPQPGQTFTFDSEAAEEAVAYLQDLGANACIWVQRNGTPQEELARRRALFVTGTLQDLAQQKAVMELHGSADEWTAIAFPAADGSGAVLAYGYSLGLIQKEGNSSDQQMAAWLFLRWLSQPAQAARLAEAWPSFPVNAGVMEQLEKERQNFPWRIILPVGERVLPAPGGPQWALTSRVMEDVTWSIFHLPKEQTEELLAEADAALEEMRERPAPTP